MLPLFVTLFSALVISLGATRVVRDAAVTLGALDPATSSRKVHTRPLPRLGGLGIVTGVYGALVCAMCLPGIRPLFVADGARLLGLAVAGMAMVALGVFDDLRGAGARMKFGVQIGAALLLYAVGFRIDAVENPFGPDILLGMLSLPMTVLWIAGVSNAINLIDGLDGLAGGIALVGAVVVLSFGAHASDAPAMLIAAALAGGIVGFLAYNVNPASIFMGDTGSLFLGTMLAALALRPHGEGNLHAVPLIAMAVALGVPIADTFLAMFRRLVRGTPIFVADREHLHHRLLELGLGHGQAVMVLWLTTAVLGAAGLFVAFGTRGRGLVLFLTTGAMALMAQQLDLIRLPSAELGVRRRHNRERLGAVRTVSERLRRATRLADVCEEVVSIAPALDAKAVALRLAATGEDAPGPGSTRFALDPRTPQLGALEVTWSERRGVADRDTEIAIEILCHNVVGALHRIDRRPTAAVTASLLGDGR